MRRIREIRFSVTIAVVAGAFALAALLIAANELFDLPFLIWGAAPTPVNRVEIAVEASFVLAVGTVAVLLVRWLESGRRRAEEGVRESLKEKEVLLKELHHRVKNNLQVISSLLRLQADGVGDERYADMFKESEDRVKAIALIHEKLCGARDLAKIDFGEYTKGLLRDLARSYGARAARIAVRTELEDIALGINQAIPCGLIINELVSNSLKHAFPEGREGEIRIGLRRTGENGIGLAVSDNGVGLAGGPDLREVESLGLRLVTILAEDQLGGEIRLDRSGGTRFEITFKEAG